MLGVRDIILDLKTQIYEKRMKIDNSYVNKQATS